LAAKDAKARRKGAQNFMALILVYAPGELLLAR
jgi:hypothetical protein